MYLYKVGGDSDWQQFNWVCAELILVMICCRCCFLEDAVKWILE